MLSAVTFTFTAAHDRYPVLARTSVLAGETDRLVTDDVVDATPFRHLRRRPDLDVLGVPRHRRDRQATSGADDLGDRAHGRAETVGEVALGSESGARQLGTGWSRSNVQNQTRVVWFIIIDLSKHGITKLNIKFNF